MRFVLTAIGYVKGELKINFLELGSWVLFCVNAKAKPFCFYLEILGVVLFDSYPDDLQ